MAIDRVAILLDGEFVKKVLSQRLGSFPTAANVEAEVTRIPRSDGIAGRSLYRVFY